MLPDIAFRFPSNPTNIGPAIMHAVTIFALAFATVAGRGHLRFGQLKKEIPLDSFLTPFCLVTTF